MTDPTLAAALAAAECAVMRLHYHAPDGTTSECVLHAERLAAQPAVIAWAEGRDTALRKALLQAYDRLDDIFETLHPGDLTPEERESIAQIAWFGKGEAYRAANTSPEEPPIEYVTPPTTTLAINESPGGLGRTTRR